MIGLPKPERLIKPGNRAKHLLEHPRCEYVMPSGLACGNPAVTVHHKKYRSQGGGDGDDNLESLDDFHHRTRHDTA